MRRDSIRKIFLSGLDSKTSPLCIAEQTAVQVEQTKQGVRSSLPPPHQKRICNYGALPRLPLGNMALFLNRLGHRELSFRGRRQQTAALTFAHLHICTHADKKLILPSPSLSVSFLKRQTEKCETDQSENKPLCPFLPSLPFLCTD